MNKTLVTDTMCIIHTFHFRGKAVTAFTAWSHTTSDRDCITSENISTLRRCGLWTGNVEMKPKVLPKGLLVILCLWVSSKPTPQPVPGVAAQPHLENQTTHQPSPLLKRDATQLLVAWPDCSLVSHTLPTSISPAVSTAYYNLIIFLP